MEGLRFTAAFVLLLPYLAGCSITPTREYDSAEEGITFGTLPSHWHVSRDQELKKLGTNFAAQNEKSNSYLAVNSLCNRYPNTKLRGLMRQLTQSFEGKTSEQDDTGVVDGREALFSKVRGKLDGVPVESLLVVFRKNDCIFDFMVHSPERLPAEDEEAFRAFVSAFHFNGHTSALSEAKD